MFFVFFLSTTQFIQKRQEGDGVDFDRGMGSYRRGFGDPTYSHWLGLDKIRSLVTQDEYQLRIEVQLYNGRTANAYYSYFKIGDYASNYALEVGNYNGTAGEGKTVGCVSCLKTTGYQYCIPSCRFLYRM